MTINKAAIARKSGANAERFLAVVGFACAAGLASVAGFASAGTPTRSE
jgi:hypothetical protein